METTGVLIIHNDSSLLAQTLKSAQGLVDRLVVVDGAYEWVAPFCEMSGEDPERSTDDLIQILDDCGLPYSYHTGIWENETHKRRVSMQLVETKRMMLIDSDEIYDVDADALAAFWASGKVLGSLYAPLFLHDDVVTQHKPTGQFPAKSVFINSADSTIDEIVVSLWLMLPDSEKGQRLPPAKIEQNPLGIFYHLSMLRTQNNPYRRSRFYNLLSMRVGKTVPLPGGGPFASDREFVELIKKLDRRALNNMFNFHGLAAGFPQQKANQNLIEFHIEDTEKAAIVAAAYQDMLRDQAARTKAICGQSNPIFAGRAVHLDVTAFVKGNKGGLKLTLQDGVTPNLTWHIDCGTERHLINAGSGDYLFPDLAPYPGMRRVIAQISLHKPGTDVVDFRVDFIG